MLKIYFAHATTDYKSDYAKKYMLEVKKLYPGYKIVDPSTIKTPEDFEKKPLNEQMQIYYNVICQCEIVVTLKQQITKKYTPGVLREMEYAKNNGIPIIQL